MNRDISNSVRSGCLKLLPPPLLEKPGGRGRRIRVVPVPPPLDVLGIGLPDCKKFIDEISENFICFFFQCLNSLKIMPINKIPLSGNCNCFK